MEAWSKNVSHGQMNPYGEIAHKVGLADYGNDFSDTR